MSGVAPGIRPLVGVVALLAMLLPFWVACSQPTDVNEEEAIRRILASQVEAWNAGDIEAFMQGYDRSDELLFASGDQVTRGWQTTLQRYLTRYDSPTKMGQLAFEVLQVDALGTQHAKVLGRWRLTREDDTPHGLFTLILARREGSWRIIHDHTSSASE